MQDGEKNTILITGVGIKLARKQFNNDFSDIIIIKGEKYKLNIGAAIAKVLLQNGYKVIMVSKSLEKLELITRYFLDNQVCIPCQISTAAVDLLNESQVEKFIESLHPEQNIWVVHSVGLNSNMYEIKKDNPYLPFDKIKLELLNKEIEIPVSSLLLLMRYLQGKISNQKLTKIVIITSMSAIRPYIYGYSHCAAKAALHNATRSLTLELSYNYKSVFVSEILPGIVDTGMYDSDEIIKIVSEIGETFGYRNTKKYTVDNFPIIKPSDIGKAVLFIFESNSHILSINLVAQNQFPHSGA